MKRCQFIASMSAGVASLASVTLPKLALAQSDRPRITDIRVHRMKTLGETGMMESAWAPGRPYMRRIGGGTVTEIFTDQGISGIAPANGVGTSSATSGFPLTRVRMGLRPRCTRRSRRTPDRPMRYTLAPSPNIPK